jgi:hypothetical protein
MQGVYPLAALALATAGLIACTQQDATGDNALAGGARKEVLAPVEAAEVVVRESFPPQYAVRITSGLPSGCAVFDRIDVERDGAVLEVTVWNTLPADDRVACTMIYGIADHTRELGGDFESGQTYEVRVNGEARASFTAQ